jgi:peptidyl-prolyl cis-trans isomerase A (cyclophilin A)
MIRRIALSSLFACAAPAAAQTPPQPETAVAPAPKEDLVKVALQTDVGRIVIALDRGRAPATTANFLHYVTSGKLNGENFYRAMRFEDGGGLVQGGIQSDARKLVKPVAHEPTSKTGLKHVAGAISMANFGPGTARSDFFILASDIPSLDAKDGNEGFAVFGHVVEGMEVVKTILAAPVSPTKGQGVMRGQMLEPAIRIVKAEKVKE